MTRKIITHHITLLHIHLTSRHASRDRVILATSHHVTREWQYCRFINRNRSYADVASSSSIRKDHIMTATKTRSLSSVTREIATKTGADVTDVGKSTRAHIRKNRDTFVKSWPGLKNHERGNRYPDMPASFADELIASRVASMSRAKQINT